MSGKTKAERLEEMKRLYIQRAYSDIDMAEVLGVTRETVFRDRRELATGDNKYYFEKDEQGRYYIPKTSLLSNIKLKLHESLALYLASRKTIRQTRFQQTHTKNALEKLSATLYQPMTERLFKSAEKLTGQEKSPEKIKIIETITQAWVEQRKVRIEYQPLIGEGITRHTISPYVIEPSIWSDSVYVIAKSDFNDRIFSFKIERILSAFLSGETFEIPESFDDEQLLKHAWGIWVGDKEPITVKLRFSPGVTRRVKESIWHPLEKVEDTEDGGCIWSVDIAEWREMLPWIRGWGADCEVLEPKELRDALVRETQDLAELYKVVEMKKKLIAHISQKDRKEQLLMTHLTEASELAEGFAGKVGLPEIGKIMGLLHDFGKASDVFQGYIRSKQGIYSPDDDEFVDAQRGEVDHSTAGAQLIYEKLADRGQASKILAQFLSVAIASHHSGLIDCLTPSGNNKFEDRIKKADEKTHLEEARRKLPEIEKQLDEILTQPIEERFYKKIFDEMIELSDDNQKRDSESTLPFKHGLLARFLLSCLLEADRLNTAKFENPRDEVNRNDGKYVTWDILVARIESKFAEFAQTTAQMQAGRALDINQLRTQVAQACLDAAGKPKGIYQLTVPTGGGKTLASLRFALHHARAHTNDNEKIERIFYIVPYITIIDQNADKVRKILETANERGKVVLEHHSNFVPTKDTRRRYNLLSENWDAPIVFTTQVQFLEALFGYGTRDTRRMHQLANSVIILDEVQTVPINIVHMLNTALRFLAHDCGSTIVLCTATQPPLDKLPKNPYRALTIKQEQKIIQNEPELFKNLKRVEVQDKRKPIGSTHAEVAKLTQDALLEKGSVLVVVNTRASALALYDEIKKLDLGVKIYHLSTNMCPAHRVEVLENKIKPALKAKEPVICVSTQLIEAGVDIDFGAVIRSLAGLDSIAQSAGRCNRHGEREDGFGSVYVVNLKDENLSRLPDIQIGQKHADTILNLYKRKPSDYDEDAIGLQAITKYYRNYFQDREDKLEYPVEKGKYIDHADSLFNLLSRNTNAYKKQIDEKSLKQSFMSASKMFRVIDSLTIGVIVPYGEGKEIITDLCGDIDIRQKRELLKRAQRYSVQLFRGKYGQFEKLKEKGAIQQIKDDEIFYLVSNYYDDVVGWSEESTGNEELLSF
ncbi:MAG: CRISPR-associated helicase Cas3' [Anaerolineales bacterium]|nr:CRISPR-associated helicase Cas3' [Anaerolineales bacterium]